MKKYIITTVVILAIAITAFVANTRAATFVFDSYYTPPVLGIRSLYNSGVNNSVTQNTHGQTFTASQTGTLSTAKFVLSKSGSPTGTISTYIYATSFDGTGYTPTGSPLATSDSIDMSTIGSSATTTFNFSGANQITLNSGTKYALVIITSSGNSSNNIRLWFGADNTHSGNAVYFTNVWNYQTSLDFPFSVEGTDTPSSASLSTVSDTVFFE